VHSQNGAELTAAGPVDILRLSIVGTGARPCSRGIGMGSEALGYGWPLFCIEQQPKRGAPGRHGSRRASLPGGRLVCWSGLAVAVVSGMGLVCLAYVASLHKLDVSQLAALQHAKAQQRAWVDGADNRVQGSPSVTRSNRHQQLSLEPIRSRVLRRIRSGNKRTRVAAKAGPMIHVQNRDTIH
jgi:hypothetical protein